MSVLYLTEIRLNFTSNFLDQDNLKSKYLCKNEVIYIRDFEAIQKTRSRVLSGVKTLDFVLSFTSFGVCTYP